MVFWDTLWSYNTDQGVLVILDIFVNFQDIYSTLGKFPVFGIVDGVQVN